MKPAGVWERIIVPQFASFVGKYYKSVNGINCSYTHCYKCGRTDIEACLNTTCLDVVMWKDCINNITGKPLGGTLFICYTTLHNEECAVCTDCLLSNWWSICRLQSSFYATTTTFALAGLCQWKLFSAWKTIPIKCVSPDTCPLSLEIIDDCTGWCPFCAFFCLHSQRSNKGVVSCVNLEICPPATIPHPIKMSVISLATLCKWRMTTWEQSYIKKFDMVQPKRIVPAT